MGILSGIIGGGIGAIAEAGKSIATTIADAKAKRIDSEVALAQLEQQLPALQAQINLAESGSVSLFVSGWRPACGWVCVMGLFYAYVFRPIINGVFDTTRFAELDIQTLLSILVPLLGLAVYRTVEKVKGVARE